MNKIKILKPETENREPEQNRAGTVRPADGAKPQMGENKEIGGIQN